MMAFPTWPLAAQVPEWILKLLSVDTDKLAGGTEHFRFARFPEGGLGLLTILAILAGFALIVWNYRREGQLAQWKKAAEPLEKTWADNVRKTGNDPAVVMKELKDELAKQNAAY